MVTRREFLRKAALGAALSLVVPRLTTLAQAEEKAEKPPELPWPYTKLDPEETRKLGHLGYYAFECCGGAFWAIAVQLKEKVGYPWTLLPIPSKEEVIEMVNKGEHAHIAFMQFGHGGGFSYGGTCGALLGASAIINLVAKNKKDMDKMGRALYRWYEMTPIPSDKINEYAVKGQLYVKKLKYSGWLPSNVCGSILCHVSVSTWCRHTGYASGSKARSERCGRLTGDVAATAVEMLNAYVDGRLDDVLARLGIRYSATTTYCRECHYKGKDFEIGQFARGYIQCESCHRDMRPHAHMIVGTTNTEKEKAKQQFSITSLVAAGAAAGVAAGAVAGIVNGLEPRTKKHRS